MEDTNHDDRVNYVEFLRPFASRRSKNRQAIEETTLVVQVSFENTSFNPVF